jgi:prepilin peptidase CpaA
VELWWSNAVNPPVGSASLSMQPVLFTVVLVVLALLASASDLRSRRVPNLISALLLIAGMVASMSRLGLADGAVFALAGAATGLALWLPAYAARLIGAGDVKLFAGGAAWLGWNGALLAAVVTAVAGGALGLVWLLRRRGKESAALSVMMALSSPRLLQLQPLDRRERVPYALAISVGLLSIWIHALVRHVAGGT